MKLSHLPEARAATIRSALASFCATNKIPGLAISKRKYSGLINWCSTSAAFKNTDDWTLRICWDVFQLKKSVWIRHKISIGTDIGELPSLSLDAGYSELLQNRYRANMTLWCGWGTKDLRFIYNPEKRVENPQQ